MKSILPQFASLMLAPSVELRAAADACARISDAEAMRRRAITFGGL
jgi:hypothetical protein